MVWSKVWDGIKKSSVQRQMVSEAAELGLVHGISVPIRGPNGDLGGVGFSTNLNELEATRLIDGQWPLVFTMAHNFNDVMLEKFVYQSARNTVIPLTERELNCLYWAALGNGTWEISEIQGVSENTVKFHFGNIRAKLDVPNRTAAVAKAIRMGILN